MKQEEGLTKKILMGIALGGAIYIAASSPYFVLNLMKMYLKRDEYNEYKRKYIDKKRKLAKAFEYLKRNRLVLLREEKGGELIVKLTEKGKRRVKKYQIDDLKIEAPKKWDKKWRMVIFDIPDKIRKAARDALRKKLKSMNFYQLQKSIWVHPYPCHNEVQLLTSLFDIECFVNFVVADDIYDDIRLKEYFDLL